VASPDISRDVEDHANESTDEETLADIDFEILREQGLRWTGLGYEEIEVDLRVVRRNSMTRRNILKTICVNTNGAVRLSDRRIEGIVERSDDENMEEVEGCSEHETDDAIDKTAAGASTLRPHGSTRLPGSAQAKGQCCA
jgi:hypothetical protein